MPWRRYLGLMLGIGAGVIVFLLAAATKFLLRGGTSSSPAVTPLGAATTSRERWGGGSTAQKPTMPTPLPSPAIAAAAAKAAAQMSWQPSPAPLESSLQCRRELPAVVKVKDQPLTFSFPAYRTCYQPTMQVLEERGWRWSQAAGFKATLVSRPSDPARSAVRATNRQPFREGEAYMDRLPNYTSIGGSKFVQWQLKQELAASHGCQLSSLPLFPEQYVLTIPSQCHAFFKRFSDSGTQQAHTWILKQASGDYRYLHATHGIQLVRSDNASAMEALHARFGGCAVPPSNTPRTGGVGQRRQQQSEHFILQAEVVPLLLGSRADPLAPWLRKFDFRAFMLVARTAPLFAFAHDGTSCPRTHACMCAR
eukprot:COSAG01_NODE_6182_length_3805_cov_3.174852_4_plen_366_part_00